jgi:lipopolysaccharide/colanic/teichoic acid biosynthesis glycosyltransferase
LAYRNFIKPFFDWITALVFLVLCSPFFIILILILTLVHKGSPFFVQQRIGLKGGYFSILKFRTINKTGEITAFLSFLRKTKLDETPQILNILKGEMSWIGPRPDIAGYYDTLKGENRKILDLKPGLTGIASLAFIDEEFILAEKENPMHYNDTIIFPEKVKLNRYYRRYISFTLDLKILIKTLILLLKPKKPNN